MTRQIRSVPSEFKTRADGDELYIEGYFSVFNTEYRLWDKAVETVLPGAFSETLGGDIRALIDHDTRLVLGRTKAGTLRLQEDQRGLWGEIRVNRDDVDAMNLYARVQRGDVDQCSFGFDINEEEFEELPDGNVKWKIKRVTLYEVSVVTFPAYEETSVQARKSDYEKSQERKAEYWKSAMRKKLRGEL